MDCKIDIIPRVLHFKQPAGTSRGTYTTRKVWYLHFTAPEFPNWVGIGECAPLPNLSCDDLPDYEEVLAKICRQVENQGGKLDMEALCKYPSILFGLETAIRHFFEGSWALWDTRIDFFSPEFKESLLDVRLITLPSASVRVVSTVTDSERVLLF